MNPQIQPSRKEEIRQEAIDAINSLGSRFFYVEIQLNSLEEAIYAASLWPHASIVQGTNKVGYRPRGA